MSKKVNVCVPKLRKLWDNDKLFLYEIAQDLKISINTLINYKRLLKLPNRRAVPRQSDEMNSNDPTPEQIAQRCLEIQKMWPPSRFHNIHVIPVQTGLRKQSRFKSYSA